MEILNQLNTLISIIQDRGFPINECLQPGLSREAIAIQTSHLPFDFPQELYTLYQWRNGTNLDCQFSFFRDQLFLPLEEALKSYDEIAHYYVEELEELNIDWEIDLRYCFPFASFEGSYYVLVCDSVEAKEGQIFNIFEGIEKYFNSFSTMLATGIAWGQQGVIKPYGIELSPELELEIWRRYNPGVFD